jgi:hypothetical protein
VLAARTGGGSLPSDDRPSGAKRDADRIDDAVSRFGLELLPRMQGDGWPEDKLRAPVYGLVKEIGTILGPRLTVHDEVRLVEPSCRPDFAVDTPAGRAGYIELKALDKGIPENWRPTQHDREQWDKFRSLPNLIYTNGKLWALYRNGILEGEVAEIAGDLNRSGPKLRPVDGRFEALFRNFLSWKPKRPLTLQAIVAEVAPLCRLLREQVAETIAYEATSPGKRPLTTLAHEWRSILFPNLTDAEFADAYAQTITFSLLLARVDDISFDGKGPGEIAEQLTKQHSLMGEALGILTNSRWVERLSVVKMLLRIIGNIQWNAVHSSTPDAYAVLYESFLEEYDSNLRRQSGTYYTPDPVAHAMITFVDEILKQKLRKRRGFADRGVVVVDPAMGTGTFLVHIIDSVASTMRQELNSSVVPKSHLRELFKDRLVGFELKVAPYAVAELRLHHVLRQEYGVELPREEVRFLSNALDDPDTLPMSFGQLYDALREAKEGADRIKRDIPVMVVVGNPPWREQVRGKAPWIEKRRDPRVPPNLQQRPSLDEFRSEKQARRAFNLSNMWTYFWRWSIWKAFEANPDHPAGVVALITPSAYASSESFEGMRRHLRETADEGWIIDLTPEDFQPDSPTRPFIEVQQPICIGVFARCGRVNRRSPATIHYISVKGSRDQKFAALQQISVCSSGWVEASDAWTAPFLPAPSSIWAGYPRVVDLFPWHITGMNANRKWVWSPDAETIRRRWSMLMHADQVRMAELFKTTDARTIKKPAPKIPGFGEKRPGLLSDDPTAQPLVSMAAPRSFDRQYVIKDWRVLDRPRVELWQILGPDQIFITEQHAHPIEDGPGLTFTELIPGVDHFNGRGGRVLPCLLNDGKPNAPDGLLDELSRRLGVTVHISDLLAYVAAVTAHPAFTARFRDELRVPGVRLPMTASSGLWLEAVKVGRLLLWLHSYGTRYIDESDGRPCGPPLMSEENAPQLLQSVGDTPEDMPRSIKYDEAQSRIYLKPTRGAVDKWGIIGRVSPAVWNYRVGGKHVIRTWFGYRQGASKRRRSTSELDTVVPDSWMSEYDDQLFRLLHVLGRCVELEPEQELLLDRICSASTISWYDLQLALPRQVSQPHTPISEGTLFDA